MEKFKFQMIVAVIVWVVIIGFGGGMYYAAWLYAGFEGMFWLLVGEVMVVVNSAWWYVIGAPNHVNTLTLLMKSAQSDAEQQ